MFNQRRGFLGCQWWGVQSKEGQKCTCQEGEGS